MSIDDMDAYLWVTDNVLHQIKALDKNQSDEIRDAIDLVKNIEDRKLYKMIGEKKVIWKKNIGSSVCYRCDIFHMCVKESEAF